MRYSTGSSELNALLGGGVASNSIVQIAGPPGSGREQVFANVIRSALAVGEHVLSYTIHGSDTCRWTESLRPQDCSRWHCHLVNSLTELFLLLNRVQVFVKQRPNTHVMAIDGLSALIDELPRDSLRKAYLKRIENHLMRLSSMHNLTILFSTNVATKLLSEDGSIGSYDTGSKAVLAPSLGTRDLMFQGERILLLRKTRDSRQVAGYSPVASKIESWCMYSEARHIRSGGGIASATNVRFDLE